MLANLRFAGGARGQPRSRKSRSRRRERHPPAYLWRRGHLDRSCNSAYLHLNIEGEAAPAPSAAPMLDYRQPSLNSMHATRPLKGCSSLCRISPPWNRQKRSTRNGSTHRAGQLPTVEDGAASMRFIEACISFACGEQGVDGGLASLPSRVRRFGMNGEPVRWTREQLCSRICQRSQGSPLLHRVSMASRHHSPWVCSSTQTFPG